jgi:hypothetical protein
MVYPVQRIVEKETVTRQVQPGYDHISWPIARNEFLFIFRKEVSEGRSLPRAKRFIMCDLFTEYLFQSRS